MAVAAYTLRIVVRLVWVTGIAGFSFVHRPLMRHMACRAIDPGVSRLQMQFRAIWMAGNTRRERLDLLLLEMARRAWKGSHRCVRRVRVAARTLG